MLATAGDRLALEHHRWTAADGGPPFEIETLGLIEVDAEGRIVAIIAFDPGDRRAASAEMLERYARSDEARCLPAAAFEALRAVNDHDLDRFRATLHDDFVFDDRRRTGVGRLEGADDYIASLRPLFEGAPDFYADNLYDIATERHGWLTIGRTSARSPRAGSSNPSTFGSFSAAATGSPEWSSSSSRTSTPRGRASRSCDPIRCASRRTLRRGRTIVPAGFGSTRLGSLRAW